MQKAPRPGELPAARLFGLKVSGQQMQAYAWGRGEKLLICFHGFRESGSSFSCLEPVLGSYYTLVAVDLPHQGSTQWEKPFLDRTDLESCIQILLQRFGCQRFSLMGYSLGGRVCLFITESMASRIDELILLASDGIRMNLLPYLVTRTGWGSSLFLYTIRHPLPFFSLMRLGRSLALVNQSLERFVHQFMDTPEKRNEVYRIWRCLSSVIADLSQVRNSLRKYRIKTLLFYGKFDRVFRPKQGKRFIRGLENCRLEVLDKGHNLLSQELGLRILQYMDLPL